MDNFGEDLIANPRAGSVYYWDNSNGLNTRAVELTDLTGANLAPTRGLQVIVSDVDRHVLVLGADPISNTTGLRTGSIDPLLIAFSNQEDISDWEPRSDNTAGSLRCSAGSEIIGGIRARQETLIWTDAALYSLQFIGTPFTFGLNLINEGVTLIEKDSINTQVLYKALNAQFSLTFMMTLISRNLINSLGLLIKSLMRLDGFTVLLPPQ